MFRRSSSATREDQRPPRIAACFLIRFDRKIGYTITWRRSIPGLELEGSVEYSSLPSGLHKVKEDLVYYTHKQFAGVSAFSQEPSDESERNAQFLAVGILVPLQGGWLGKAWLHALQLRQLAKDLLKDVDRMHQLENYWQTYGITDPVEEDVMTGLPKISSSESLNTLIEGVSSQHPILSTLQLLDEFGPLLFPVYRAALLRQRLLLLKEPPVRICCDYVYILALITSIPSKLADKVLTHSSLSKIVPLFSIGISDIPMLESAAASQDVRDRATSSQPSDGHAVPQNRSVGWIACSSDELLFTKPSLSDLRIMISPSGTKQWPAIHANDGTYVKATQRDLRRYRALRQSLHSMLKQSQNDNSDEVRHRRSSSTLPRSDSWPSEIDIAKNTSMAERQSWAAMAHDSYMWWVSAGEQSADLQEEMSQYDELLSAAGEACNDTLSVRRGGRGGQVGLTMAAERLEMVLISYFRGLTTSIMESLLRVVASAANVNDTVSDFRVFISKADLVEMGLDPWSQNDRLWVVDMVKAYFGRDADVQGASIECCGVKIY